MRWKGIKPGVSEVLDSNFILENGYHFKPGFSWIDGEEFLQGALTNVAIRYDGENIEFAYAFCEFGHFKVPIRIAKNYAVAKAKGRLAIAPLSTSFDRDLFAGIRDHRLLTKFREEVTDVSRSANMTAEELTLFIKSKMVQSLRSDFKRFEESSCARFKVAQYDSFARLLLLVEFLSFQHNSNAVFNLRAKFTSMKQNGRSVSSFIEDFKDCIDQLCKSGSAISDQEQLTVLFQGVDS